jgi:hypothetical protein
MILMDSVTPTLLCGKVNCQGPMNVGSERNVSFLHLSNFDLTRRSLVPSYAQIVMRSACTRPCFEQAFVFPSFQWFENCSTTWIWCPTSLLPMRGGTSFGCMVLWPLALGKERQLTARSSCIYIGFTGTQGALEYTTSKLRRAN